MEMDLVGIEWPPQVVEHSNIESLVELEMWTYTHCRTKTTSAVSRPVSPMYAYRIANRSANFPRRYVKTPYNVMAPNPRNTISTKVFRLRSAVLPISVLLIFRCGFRYNANRVTGRSKILTKGSLPFLPLPPLLTPVYSYPLIFAIFSRFSYGNQTRRWKVDTSRIKVDISTNSFG